MVLPDTASTSIVGGPTRYSTSAGIVGGPTRYSVNLSKTGRAADLHYVFADLAVFLNADLDPAAFLMRILIISVLAIDFLACFTDPSTASLARRFFP